MKPKSQTRSPGGLLLRKWRTDNAINQTDAASRFGAQASQISKFENGLHAPSVHTAIRIAQVTGGMVPIESWAKQNTLKKAS